ncbi:MAG: carotenoid biosynthesis protein [Cryomorphaceae bacterium]|nr:carotenoid biosynthesis protein [Cryomorphaceae bacterium]
MNLLKSNPLITIIVIIHFVGLMGLSIPFFRQDLLPLSSVNLLITGLFVFYVLKKENKHAYGLLAMLFVMGMVVEIIGVQTGFPFGEYAYGTVLGPKLGGVSLIIGLNWFYLVVCAVAVTQYLTKNKWLIVFIAPLLLTFMDVLIEPVAIALGYWHWELVEVPLSNYIAWYVVSIPMVLLYLRFTSNPPKRFPAQVFVVQMIFFLVLNSVLY